MENTSITISKRQTDKKSKEVPKGATITSENIETRVEKITNGYLLIKSTNIDYYTEKNGHRDYGYSYKDDKTYYEKNPLEFTKDTPLADLID